MAWWRRLLAEIFPAWHERQLLRNSQTDNGAGLNALQRFRMTIARQDEAQLREMPAPDSNAQKHTRETSLLGQHVSDSDPAKRRDR
jgi:hypothetical protein